MGAGPDPETLLDLTQDKVAVIDEDGICRHVNAAVVDLLGFEPAEFVGTDAFALVHPEDEDRLQAAFAEIVAGEATPDGPLEYRYRTADGEWVWLRTRVYVPAETGVDGYVLTSRDVTREVESRRRLETIASVSTDVFWMFTPDWSELLFVNDAVERLFGVSAERLKREPQIFLESIHPEDRPYVERAMGRLSAGESTLLDYRLGTVDGATRWVRVPGEPVVERGEVVAVTGFARDVTDEYRRERQLAVMDNLLRHTIRNDMNIVDGTAERIADRVADAAAFDPETRTEGGTATAAESAAELAELGEEIAEHAATIRRVASDLLTTAEKQRDVIDLLRQRGSPRSVAVAPLIEEAIEAVVDNRNGDVAVAYREPVDGGTIDERLAADGVLGGATDGGAAADDTAPRGEGSIPKVFVSYPRGLEAFTHPELDHAITELIENAIEHAESPPLVRVDVSATDGDIEISIRDNCPPIPPEERYVITDRWEMDDLRHTGGMGLWLVYWVADRSGGGLGFDTHANGNVVTLTVPDAGCESARDGDARMTAPERPRTSAPLREEATSSGLGDAERRSNRDDGTGTD